MASANKTNKLYFTGSGLCCFLPGASALLGRFPFVSLPLRRDSSFSGDAAEHS